MSSLAGGQVAELLPGLWRVVAPNPSFMTGPGTNSYLVGGAGPLLGSRGERIPGAMAVIDPGPDDPLHRDRLIAAAPAPIRYVLVTHHHGDHAPGAAALAALTGATVLAYEARGALRPHGELRDGDAVVVPGWRLSVLETPGHASDHLCFLGQPASGSTRLDASAEGNTGVPGRRPPVLFSGDHVLGATSVVVPPPDGDMAAYLESLRRLAALDPPIGTIAPGHGDLLDDPQQALARYLAHRLEREQQVLAAVRRRGSARVEELVDELYTARPGRLHDAAGLSVWAHLRKLAADGALSSSDPDDRAASWSTTT